MDSRKRELASRTLDVASPNRERAFRTLDVASPNRERAFRTLNVASQNREWAFRTLDVTSQNRERAFRLRNVASQNRELVFEIGKVEDFGMCGKENRVALSIWSYCIFIKELYSMGRTMPPGPLYKAWHQILNTKYHLWRVSIAELQKEFWEELKPLYDAREARAVTRLVLETLLQLNPTQLSLERFHLLTTHQQQELQKVLTRLKTGEPVQYILGETDFYGLKFKVNHHVLIPRPETEELVEWIISDFRNLTSDLRLLDIGTGSGCIPIVLSKKLPHSRVKAIDVSELALQVAEENIRLNGTSVQFRKVDILSEELPPQTYDVIVSNPPYITEAEKITLHKNVLNFEPHLALFSFDEDGLKFYRRIAQLAATALKPKGKIYFEIHCDKAEEVALILTQAGYRNVELRKDLSGNNRMVKATKN